MGKGFVALEMKRNTVYKYRRVGYKVVCASTCHDLAPDSQGQWGSETSSSTGPLQHTAASPHSHLSVLEAMAKDPWYKPKP